MVWARLEDSFTEHPKIVGLSDRAFRLHVSAIVYCSRLHTDGVVPGKLPRLWGFTTRHVNELVAACLWETVPPDYQIHDFLDYNPSREDVEAKRDRVSSIRSEAGKRGAEKRWQNNGNHDSKTDGKNGKSMANAMANRWPRPEPIPSPDDDDDPDLSGDRSSSSGDPGGGHAFAIDLPFLPWQQQSTETLIRTGQWEDSETDKFAAIDRDYEPEQVDSAMERVEARGQLPFARNLRRELIAEFGEPSWVRAKSGPLRYG